MQKSAPQAPNAWLSYVLVTSVVDTVKKAEGLGASVIVPLCMTAEWIGRISEGAHHVPPAGASQQ